MVTAGGWTAHCQEPGLPVGYMEVWPMVLTTRDFVLRIPAPDAAPPELNLEVSIQPEVTGPVRVEHVTARWQDVPWPAEVWRRAGLPDTPEPRGAWIASIPIEPTTPGRYRFRARGTGPQAGMDRVFEAEPITLHPRPAWCDVRAGIEGLSQVPRPWTPVEVAVGEGAPVIKCWNRTLFLDPAGVLLTRLSSGSEELLARPMTLEAVDDTGARLKPVGQWQMDPPQPTQVTCRRALKGSASEIAVSLTTEYDGLTWVRLELRGEAAISHLTLTIPLAARLVPLIYYYPDIPWYFGNLYNVVRAPRNGYGWSASYREFFFFGGPRAGLQWASDSAALWESPHRPDTVQAIAEADVLEVRMHLLRGGKPTRNGIFEFALQATPVKPWPEDPLQGRVATFNWDEASLLAPFTALGEPFADMRVLDRMKQAGIQVVHLGEWWTTAWGGTEARDPQALRNLTAEAHRRGMQVIVYFGFEMDETLEDFQRFGWELLGGDPRLGSYSYREDRFYPPERFDHSKPARKVYGSDRSGPEMERLLAGMKTLLTDYGVDGFYLDGTQLPTGNLRRARELMKRMRYLVDTYASTRGVIYAHTSSRNDISVNGFADVVYNGEQLRYAPFLQGRRHLGGAMPLDYLELLMNGHPWGVPHDLCDDTPEYVDFALLLGTGAGTYQWSEDYWPLKRVWLTGDLWHADYTPPDVAMARWPDRPPELYVSAFRSRNDVFTVVLFNARGEDIAVSLPVRQVLQVADRDLSAPQVVYSRQPASWRVDKDEWLGVLPAGSGVALRAAVR